MDQTKEWENFWNAFRVKNVESEDDLFFQVGKTINKKPIDKEVFHSLTKNLVEQLSLNKNDLIVELCCGNGLCTYELKDYVKQIISVDFAIHLIEAAKKFKSAPNITYCQGNVFDFLKNFKSDFKVVPAKYLMNDSIMYFNPEDLKKILTYILDISNDGFTFLITGAPNDLLKWNFYNTEERKTKYLEGVASGDYTNDGIGRWWTAKEIEDLCSSLNLKCSIRNQPEAISNYRMNIVISK